MGTSDLRDEAKIEKRANLTKELDKLAASIESRSAGSSLSTEIYIYLDSARSAFSEGNGKESFARNRR